MQLTRILVLVVISLGMAACASKSTEAKSPTDPTEQRADSADAKPDAPVPEPEVRTEGPSTDEAAPQKKSRPVPGEDFKVLVGIPDDTWRPLHPQLVGVEADVLIVQPQLQAEVYLFWESYDGGEENPVSIEEIGLKVLEAWAKDDGAVNEAPASWKDPGGNVYVSVTGTFTREETKMRRRLTFRQISEKFDFAIVAIGIWPEKNDALLRLSFNEMVDFVDVRDNSPSAKPAPSDAPAPAPSSDD